MQHNTEFRLEFSSLRSLEETKILVPSAKRMVQEILFITYGKSLFYMLKINGPKTKPCGTPCLMLSQSDRKLSDLTNSNTSLCFLLRK